MSGIGNGYLSGNTLTAFPFEDGQCLAWPFDSADKRNEFQVALQKCFADAGVYINSRSLNSYWPFVGDFEVGEDAISFKIGVGSEDSDVNLSVKSSASTAFPVVSGSAPWGHYVLTLSSEGIEEFCALCESLSISPPVQQNSSSAGRDGGSWLRLCAKCITFRHVGVSSIRVYDGVSPFSSGPHFVLKGDVSIMPGNNMLILPPDGDGNGMRINAIPGAGLGVCPCVCEETPAGNNYLAGSDGHCRIFNDTCYDLEPGEIRMEHVESFGREMLTQDLHIHVKCTSCCTCSMYEDIVNRLAVIAGQLDPESGNQWKQGSVRWAKSTINNLYGKYESAVAKFNARMSAPKLSDVTMTLSGMPIGRNVSPKISGGGVSGRMSRCAFTAVVRNSSYFEVLASVTSIFGTDSIAEISASWSNESGEPKSLSVNSEKDIKGKSFSIFPGRSLVVTYVSVKNARMRSVVTGGFSGSMYVDLSYRKNDSSVAYLGRISKSVTV